MSSSGPRPRRHLSTSPFPPPVQKKVEQFAVGERVFHEAHGLGRIVDVEPAGAVLVDFGERQVRIVTPYPKLSKL